MSNMNLFTTTPVPKLKRNAFDLSHERKFTCDMGELRVAYWEDIVPGDTFNVSSEVFVRFGPMLAPVLHRIDVFMHYFFVPYRLLQKRSGEYGGWEDFISGDPESDFTTGLTPPYITIDNTTKAYFGWGYLPGDFGFPSLEGKTVTQDIDINVLPFLAYQLIFDEFYRDENLQDRVTMEDNAGTGDVPLVGGDLSSVAAELLAGKYRNWEKDYFTSALPTAYKGLSSDVELDLDVIADGVTKVFFERAGGATAASGAVSGVAGALNDGTADLTFKSGIVGDAYATIEMMEVRRAQALLRFYEAENRGGHRYNEMMLGIYGVISDDARLDRPEYLGGGKQAVQISEVLNTSQTFDPTVGAGNAVPADPIPIDPQANLAGKGLSMGRTNRFKKYFKEHGVVLGILSVLPRTGYADGIERFWRKFDRTDFFIPQLQNIGEQAIDQSEVFYDWAGTDKDDVFGYTPRYAEYKYKMDRVSGLFATTFDYWHCTRRFGSAPALNEAFIQATPTGDEMNRIFAVETGTDNVFIQVYNRVKAIRPMQKYSVPV